MKVNLLPPELQREGVIDFKRLVKVSVITVLIMFVLGGYAAFLIKSAVTRSELDSSRQELERLQVIVAKVEALKKERQRNEMVAEGLHKLISERGIWSNKLDDLNYSLPVDMWLTEFNLLKAQVPGEPSKVAAKPAGQQAVAGQQPSSIPKPDTLVLKGVSRSVPSIGVFIYYLNQLPYFSKVTLNEIKESDNGLMSYMITLTLKEGGW